MMERITTLFTSVFDFQDAARRAAGGAWHAQAATEQEDFTRLFASLVQRSYIHRMAYGADVSGGVDIRYLAESVDEETATVRTAIARKGGGDMLIEHKMVRRAGHWMVRDVVIDGIGIVANYGAQFRRIIRDSSYQGLVARMSAKAGDSPGPGTATSDEVGTGPVGRVLFEDGRPSASGPGLSGADGDDAVTTRLRWIPAARPQAP
jgi:ABC-type transporter MlaC component